MKCEVGQTVKLKSGGPVMTVSLLTSGGGVECHWFNQVGNVYDAKFQEFKPEMLKIVHKGG